MLLEDQIVKSQAMAASPFSAPFADRLVPWEQKLQRFQVGGWPPSTRTVRFNVGGAPA